MSPNNEPTTEFFGHLCYLILMQNGGGILDKSPDYVIEKMKALKMGYTAYQMLDFRNRKLLLAYLDKWSYDIPKEIEEL